MSEVVGFRALRPDGGMADAQDLKSCWGFPSAGSSPAPATVAGDRLFARRSNSSANCGSSETLRTIAATLPYCFLGSAIVGTLVAVKSEIRNKFKIQNRNVQNGDARPRGVAGVLQSLNPFWRTVDGRRGPMALAWPHARPGYAPAGRWRVRSRGLPARASSASVGTNSPRNALARIACVIFSTRAVAAATRASILSGQGEQGLDAADDFVLLGEGRKWQRQTLEVLYVDELRCRSEGPSSPLQRPSPTLPAIPRPSPRLAPLRLRVRPYLSHAKARSAKRIRGWTRGKSSGHSLPHAKSQSTQSKPRFMPASLRSARENRSVALAFRPVHRSC